MSFNVAVWEGKAPDSDADAAAEFDALYERHMSGRSSRPSAAIRKFVDAMLDAYGDLGDDEDEAPWSDGPLLNDASGPLFYFGIVFSRVDEVLPVVAATAKARGLVC